MKVGEKTARMVVSTVAVVAVGAYFVPECMSLT